MADGISTDPNSVTSNGLTDDQKQFLIGNLLLGAGQGLGQTSGWSRLPMTKGMQLNSAISGAASGLNSGLSGIYQGQINQANLADKQIDTDTKKMALTKAKQDFAVRQQLIANDPSLSGILSQQPQAQPQSGQTPQAAPAVDPNAPVPSAGGQAPSSPDMPQGGPPQAPSAPPQTPSPFTPTQQQLLQPKVTDTPVDVIDKHTIATAPQAGVDPHAVADVIAGGVSSNMGVLNHALQAANAKAALAPDLFGKQPERIQKMIDNVNAANASGRQLNYDTQGNVSVGPLSGYDQTVQASKQAEATGTSLGTNQQIITPQGTIAPVAGGVSDPRYLAQKTSATANAQAAADQAHRAATPVTAYNPNNPTQFMTINTAAGQTAPAGWIVKGQETPLQAGQSDANNEFIKKAPDTIQSLRNDAANISGAKSAVTDPNFQSGGLQGAFLPVKSILSNFMGADEVNKLTPQQQLDQFKGVVGIAVARSAVAGSGRLDRTEVANTIDSVGGLGNTPQATKARVAALETLNNADQNYTAQKLQAVSNGQSATDFDNHYFATHPSSIYTPQDKSAFKIIGTKVDDPTKQTVTLPKFSDADQYASWYKQYSPYMDPAQKQAVLNAYNKQSFNKNLYGN